MKRILLICLIFQMLPTLMAQEKMSPLEINPHLRIKKVQHDVSERKKLKVLNIPFEDDFYSLESHPDSNLWIDNFVYINTGFPESPPSLGVATFDGLNALGFPYSQGSNATGPADQLTSQKIDLSQINVASLPSLSFFYQPGGNGEPPEFDPLRPEQQDFFLVEFFNESGVWQRVWEQRGSKTHAFKQVILPLEEQFLHEDFQMRFRSIGSLTGGFDNWHLDYVKLDTNFTNILTNYIYTKYDSLYEIDPNTNNTELISSTIKFDTTQNLSLIDFNKRVTIGPNIAINGSDTIVVDTLNKRVFVNVFDFSYRSVDSLFTIDGEFISRTVSGIITSANSLNQIGNLNGTITFGPNAAKNIGENEYLKEIDVLLSAFRAPAFNLGDVAFQYPATSILKDYYSIPYSQFDSSMLSDRHRIQINNNFSLSTVDFVDNYRVRFIDGDDNVFSFDGPSTDLLPLRNYLLTYETFDVPTNQNADTVVLELEYSFTVTAEDTTNFIIRRNNTFKKQQIFSNYMAYDDGSMEFDYSLLIADVQEGKVALRYELNKADTLRGIRVAVANLSGAPANAVFSIVVWKSLESDSTEEEILYQEDFVSISDLIPEGDQAFNVFSVYDIDPQFILSGEKALAVDGEIYIGFIQQKSNPAFHIGYDVGTDGSENLFFDLFGTWTRSEFTGSLMMNIILGPPLPDRLVSSTPVFTFKDLQVNVYPVPTNNLLYVDMDDYANIMARLSSLDGKLLLEQDLNSKRYIDVSALAEGLYLLSLIDTKNFESAHKTIVKTR